MANVDRVLQEALDLGTAERAKVAAALLASLDDGEDADAQAAWAVELERRAERVLDGEAQSSPWREVHARLLSRLQKP